MRAQDQAAAAAGDATGNAASRRWPSQVWFILGNEAAERFSFYGVRGILTLYMTSVLLKSESDATHIHHLFVSANYFMPILGAWVADRFWGRYQTIFWISLSYCLGHGVMALGDTFQGVDAKIACLYAGLALIAFGAGAIKPCVSALMGDQFRTDQNHLLRKAFAGFYWAINVGSTAGLLATPIIRKEYGYGWAFGVPGIAMALATFVLWLGRKRYVMVPPARKTRTAGFFRIFFHALSRRNERKPGESFWDGARSRFSDAEVDAARSVAPILSIFAFAPIFWSLFDQTFSTWVLQGARMVPYSIGRFTVGPETMLAANPILVMIFVPILTWLVYPAMGRFATPLRRMALGMFLAAFSFVVVAVMQTRIEAGEQLSILWQLLPYVIITVAEVLFSTTGLEFAFREAAASMKSTITGIWWLTVCLGNLFVSVLTSALAGGGGEDAAVSTERFLLYAGMTAVVAVLFSIAASFYRYRDAAAAMGK
ncbi:MAG TPA: POT family MFS transporter [Verrucomicrobia bacterium]|nr:POT family MFS transporter [Verrucomicrobiota bacterium]HOB32105.1 MFS transporter [Verrucomicrobiota bacterium]HOP96205.1 MFS transporter [Verrucomicrobiota bacterium]HPU54679.1 MFS transporter [Verrucomicrobiota bacterium]